MEIFIYFLLLVTFYFLRLFPNQIIYMYSVRSLHFMLLSVASEVCNFLEVKIIVVKELRGYEYWAVCSW